MICRIFNLGKGDETGMHVYLDPETKRRNQELEFSTHTWAVKPLMHPTMQVENGIARASAARTTGIVGTTAEKSCHTGTNDASKESGVPSFAASGSSATNSVPRSSSWIPGPAMLESQNRTESLRGSLFSPNSAPSINNASTQNPSNSDLFGTPKPSSALEVSCLFGSNPTSSNSGDSKATPKGGLFGSNTIFANDPASKASSTGFNLDTTANSDASKGTSTSATGFSGFNFSLSTTSEAPSAKGLFRTTNGHPSRNSSRAPSASSLVGTGAVSSNREALKFMWSTDSLGIIESSSSATTGGLFRTNPPPSDTQTPENTSTAGVRPSSSTTTGSIFGTAVQPSSSTARDSIFGTAALSTKSGPSQNATGYSGFGTSSSTPRDVFDTNATTSTSHDALRFTMPIPTASNPFSAFRDTPTSTAFGSTSNTETANTSKPTRSTTPSFLISADSTPTDSPSPNPNPHQSRSPSPAPTQRPRSPQAQEARRELSPKSAAAKAKAQAAETQPAVTKDGASDERQTSD